MKSISFHLATGALAAALIVPTPAEAEPTAVDLSLGSEGRWTTSSSLRAASGSSRLALPSATLGYHLGERLPHARLAIDMSLDGALFRDVAAETRLVELRASARAIREIAGPISGFARAGAGMRRLSLTLEQNGHRIRDGGWAPTVHLGAGLEATPIRSRGGTAFGIRIETAYTFDPGETIRATRSAPDDGRITLPSSSPRLGRISSSGLGLRLGFVLSY